jgi:hypothetical protein
VEGFSRGGSLSVETATNGDARAGVKLSTTLYAELDCSRMH